MSTKKLKFHQDAIYNGKLLYQAGQTYDVPTELGFADRWIKRGAEEVFVLETIEKPIENSSQEAMPEIKTRGRKSKKSDLVGDL